VNESLEAFFRSQSSAKLRCLTVLMFKAGSRILRQKAVKLAKGRILKGSEPSQIVDGRYSVRHGGVLCFEVDFYDDSTISVALEPLLDLESTRGIFSRVEKNVKFLRDHFSFVVSDALLDDRLETAIFSQSKPLGFRLHSPPSWPLTFSFFAHPPSKEPSLWSALDAGEPEGE